MIGNDIDVVKEYNLIMRDFKVSSPITVVVSPNKNENDLFINNSLNIEKFKESCLDFAGELRERLLSENMLVDTNEKLNDIIKGVLFTKGFFSDDESTFMIIVIPEKNVDDLNNSAEFTEAVESQIDMLQEDFSNLSIGITGFAVIQKEESNAISSNFLIFFSITIILILIIFFVGLRRIIYPLLAMLPLMMGLIIMLGISAIFIRPFDLISLMTPIIIIGLGIDYAIHIGTRYGEIREELGSKADDKVVLRMTLKSIGVGLVLSMITTTFVFLSLLVSIIKGLYSFGIISALSVLTAFFSSIVILPVIIRLNEKRYINKNKSFLSGKKFHLLGRFSTSGWSIILAIIILIYSLLSIVYIPKIDFEKDILKLEPKGLKSVELVSVLEEQFDFSDTQSFFVIEGYDNLVKFRKELGRRDDDGEPVYSTFNMLKLLDARTAIRQYKKLGWGGNISTIDKYRNIIEDKVGEDRADLYEFLIKYYVNHDEDKYLVSINPNEYVWDEDFLELHLQQIKILEDRMNVTAVGLPKITDFYYRRIVKDFSLTVIIALVMIIVVILISTGSLKAVIVCSISLIISITATLTTMSIFGISIHSYNFIAFPLIIGIGIDDTIHIFYRIVYKEKDIKQVVSSSGKAILMTTLTILSAFGTIIFSVHPGLSQLAIVTSVGLIFTFLSSVSITPVLIRLLYSSNYRKTSEKCK